MNLITCVVTHILNNRKPFWVKPVYYFYITQKPFKKHLFFDSTCLIEKPGQKRSCRTCVAIFSQILTLELFRQDLQDCLDYYSPQRSLRTQSFLWDTPVKWFSEISQGRQIYTDPPSSRCEALRADVHRLFSFFTTKNTKASEGLQDVFITH